MAELATQEVKLFGKWSFDDVEVRFSEIRAHLCSRVRGKVRDFRYFFLSLNVGEMEREGRAFFVRPIFHDEAKENQRAYRWVWKRCEVKREQFRFASRGDTLSASKRNVESFAFVQVFCPRVFAQNSSRKTLVFSGGSPGSSFQSGFLPCTHFTRLL